jgi:hypothetical protein
MNFEKKKPAIEKQPALVLTNLKLFVFKSCYLAV